MGRAGASVTLSAGIVFFLGVTPSRKARSKSFVLCAGQFYFELDALLKEHRLGEDVTVQDLTRFTQLFLPRPSRATGCCCTRLIFGSPGV